MNKKIIFALVTAFAVISVAIVAFIFFGGFLENKNDSAESTPTKSEASVVEETSSAHDKKTNENSSSGSWDIESNEGDLDVIPNKEESSLNSGTLSSGVKDKNDASNGKSENSSSKNSNNAGSKENSDSSSSSQISQNNDSIELPFVPAD